MSKYDKLIYGKSDIENIVSIEVENDKAVLFLEKDGQISTQEVNHRYYILCNEKLGLDWISLAGNQHYKFGKQYDAFWKFRYDKEKFQDKDLFIIHNPVEALMIKDGYSYYKGLKPQDVSILCFDIETNGVVQDENSRVLLIANTLRINGEITRKLFCYDDYENDGEMINDWCNWVREVDPSIMCGHNVYTFDFPFLAHTAKLHNYDLNLGRNGSKVKFNNYDSHFRVDGSRDLSYRKIKIYGREIVDTMFLSYKYDIGRNYQSYGLKYIINHEGLEKEDRVFYDAGTIKDNYLNPEEWEKIKQYAEHDGDDALSLFDLMVPPFFYMGQMIPKPFQIIIESATGSQLNVLMMRSYLQDKHSIPKADSSESFEGAISFGEAGSYRNAVSLDLVSLYPSIMLQYGIHSKEKDPNNHLVKLLTYLRDQRLINKKLAKETGEIRYKHLDTSFKQLINSLYGFMGGSGLNYNYVKGAAEVTARGREILLKSIEWAKSKGFDVIKGDTDSLTIYKNGEEFSKEEIDRIIEEINSIHPEHINFDLDAVYDAIVVFKAKNYAYREGKKISTRGSAIKASTKSPALKEYINEIVNYLLYFKTEEDQVDLYKKYCREVLNIRTPEQIRRWSVRKTLSATMMSSQRPNETKVMDALKGSGYVEGDRFHVFYKPDETISLAENFDGIYCQDHLLKNVFDTVKIFDTVLPVKELFPNYTLKKNKKLLEELV